MVSMISMVYMISMLFLIYMIYRTEQANWAMIHATCLIWTKIKRGCGPSCGTMAGVWKKALNATVPWGFCPLPARGYRASDRYYYYSNHIIIILNIVIYTPFFVQPFFHDAA